MRAAPRPAELRLVPSAAALWITAAVGATAGLRGALAALALILCLVLAVALLTGRPAALRAVIPHAVLMVLGATLLLPAVARLETTREELAGAGGRIVQLDVVALGDAEHPQDGPAWAAGSWRLSARTVAGPVTIGRSTVTLPAGTRVLVRGESARPGRPDLGSVRAGDRVSVRGTVRIDGTLGVLAVREVVAIRPTAAWRRALREDARAATARLPADEAALLRGMTTGDTTGLSRGAEESMRRAGISHLIAVSGANIALVLGTVLGPLLLIGVPRRPRLLLAAGVGGAYVVLVGEEPSVLRAATMAAPILLARFLGIRASPVAALAATILLWTLASPETAASIGFVLSALATGAILLLAPPAARVITDLTRSRVGHGPALVLAVPLVAQLACTPVLLLLTPEISLWAVPVNMLVAPLVGPATVLGLLALLLGPVLPGTASALDAVAAGAAHLVLLIARSADALPGSRIPVAGGAHGALLAALVLVLALLATAARRHRAVRWAIAVVLVAVIAPPLARVLPVGIGGADQDWRIAACAVGQGDALVLRPDPGADPSTEGVVLIDTGPEPEALTACLDALHVQRIDLLILTHPHADHIGGVAALTGTRTPEQQWTCPTAEGLAATLPGVRAVAAVRGTRDDQDGMALEVLWPIDAADVERVAARETSSSEQGTANDCSVTVAATWSDGVRFVGLGDLEPAAQSALAALEPGPADVVKVAHHGSRRQDAALYAALAPRLAIIEVGTENTFGHPAAPTLRMIELLGAASVRTDRDGTVQIEPVPAGTESAGAAGSGVIARTRSVGPGR